MGSSQCAPLASNVFVSVSFSYVSLAITPLCGSSSSITMISFRHLPAAVAPRPHLPPGACEYLWLCSPIPHFSSDRASVPLGLPLSPPNTSSFQPRIVGLILPNGTGSLFVEALQRHSMHAPSTGNHPTSVTNLSFPTKSLQPSVAVHVLFLYLILHNPLLYFCCTYYPASLS